MPGHAPPRIASFLWAAPNTLLGIVAGLMVLLLGGRWRVHRGTLEATGGLIGRLLTALSSGGGAMTLGHVVLSTSQDVLLLVREHEHVHVRQYERWGPFFLPAYAASSIWQVVRGRRLYRDNCFERQAYMLTSSPVSSVRWRPQGGSYHGVRNEHSCQQARQCKRDSNHEGHH
jgi:hypothetical protein